MATHILFPDSISVYAKANLKHGGVLGGKEAPEYAAWKAMKRRCFDRKNKRFSDYGGRGISVCERWMKYENFIHDMGLRPSNKHSLDRIDNNIGYEPGNCRWSLPHQQMTNRRITKFVEIDGEMKPLATIAKMYGIPRNTLRARLVSGWDVKEALTRPVRPKAA